VFDGGGTRIDLLLVSTSCYDGKRLPTYIPSFPPSNFVIKDTCPFHSQISHSPRSDDDDKWQPTSLVRGERQALTVDESVNDEDAEPRRGDDFEPAMVRTYNRKKGR